MYTTYTYQDWSAMGGGAELARTIVKNYKTSGEFVAGCAANRYFCGENPTLDSKYLLQIETKTVTDANGIKTPMRTRKRIAGNRIASNFLRRFVCQQNQYLLGNGLTLDNDAEKTKLGAGFDKILESMGERALLHGVCYAFWNVDHVEPLPAVVDGLSGCVALLDERTSEPRVALQFWQLSEKRPLYVRCFEPDGVTVWMYANGKAETVEEKRAYKLQVRRDALGETVTGAENYDALPVLALYANNEHTSEFTENIKSKIDAYDRILSDYGDNLDRANDVYWVLNNFGGNADDALQIMQDIQTLKVAMTVSDGSSSSTAEPRTIEVPYNARQTALQLLEKALYSDWMALNMDEITGGSLTNVAIETASLNLNLKCDRYEWQVFGFVQKLLRLLGIVTEQISFKRQEIVNKPETVAAIMQMRQDIDHETALRLNPYIPADDIPDIIKRTDAEAETGYTDIDDLQTQIDALKAQNAAKFAQNGTSAVDGE